ncbi:MAG: hypothetical protein KDC38_11620 [Planctomycetes bacterium]|nr:hypothetical protein [Planctomycetota bacterium]
MNGMRFVIAVVLGGALGYFGWDALEPAERDFSFGAPRSVPSGPLVEERPAAPSFGSTVAPDVETAGGRVEAATVRRLQTGIARVESPAAVGGIGAVTGIAKSSEGTPIGDVRVRLRPLGMPRGEDDIDIVADDLERYIEKRVREYRHQHSEERATSTLPDGSFRFDGLGPYRYAIEADKPGYRLRITVEDNARSWVGPGDRVEIVQQDRATLEIDVRLPNGEQPKRAVIQTGEFSWLGQWAPGSPTIEVQPGEYELYATVETLRSERVGIEVRTDDHVPLRLDLVELPSLTILASPPAELSAATIHFHCLEADAVDGEVTPSQLVAEGHHDEDSGQGDTLPRFTLARLTPGRYVVGAGYSRGEPAVIDSVEVTDGPVEIELALPAPRADLVLRIRPLGDDGSILENAHVELYRSVEPTDLQPWKTEDPIDTRPVTDADGVVAVPIDSQTRDRLAAGEIEARVSAAGLGTQRVQIDSLDVTVRFPPAARVTFDAPLDVGPDEEIDVVLTATDHSESTASGELGESMALAAGEYDLVLLIDWVPVHTQRLRIDPGPQHITLTVPPLHALTVRGAGEELLAFPVATPNPSPVAGERSGDLHRFARLVEGPYRLMDDRGHIMNVDVPASGVVEFRGEPFNALLVAANADDDAIRETSLRPGDLIVAVEGARFEGAEEAQELFLLMTGLDQVRLTIVRDDVESTVTVPAPALRGSEFQVLPARH